MLSKIARSGFLALMTAGFVSGGSLIGQVSAGDADLLEVHGSTTVSRNVLIPNKDKLDKATGRTIHVLANGSSNGILALIKDKADVAMISAPFEDVRASVERKSPGTIGDIELVQHRIGAVKTRFIVNPDNPVRSISEEQLREVLLGTIDNWSALGGPDMPIVVFTTKPGKGLRSLVEKKFLNGQSIVASAQELTGLSQVVQVIGQAKHGIGFVNEPRLNGSVAVLPGHAVEQPLILVTKGAPDPDTRKLIKAMAELAPSS